MLNCGDMFRRLRPEELLSLIVTAFAGLILAVTSSPASLSLSAAALHMLQYFTFGDPMFAIFFLAVWGAVGWKLFQGLNRLAQHHLIGPNLSSAESAKSELKTVLEPLRLIWPLTLASVVLYALLDVMGMKVDAHTRDIWLNNLDQHLFGFSPFLHFPSVYQSPIFEILIEYAYLMLQGVIALSLVIFLLLRQTTLIRKFIWCFLMSLTLGFPLFYAVPCQDPNNFFIRNLRGHELPVAIQTELNDYSPSSETRTIIDKIQTAETSIQNNNAPISCFPSGHAMWSIFVVYFLAVLQPWTLAISLPWLFCVLSGGVYFGQHYVVDYLMALPVALLCIFTSNKLIYPADPQNLCNSGGCPSGPRARAWTRGSQASDVQTRSQP